MLGSGVVRARAADHDLLACDIGCHCWLRRLQRAAIRFGRSRLPRWPVSPASTGYLSKTAELQVRILPARAGMVITLISQIVRFARPNILTFCTFPIY
jgi:hypothetical protein